MVVLIGSIGEMDRLMIRLILGYTLFHLIVIHRFNDNKLDPPNKPSLRVVETLTKDPVNMVDMFYGTNVISSNTNSRGNIFPVVSAGPHAYNHWTFTTTGTSPWFFNKDSPKFRGIRCTHQPSLWIGDYAFFDINLSTMKTWARDMSFVTPSTMELTSGDGVTMSLSPTYTGAILKMRTTGGVNTLKTSLDFFEVDGPFTIRGTTAKSTIFNTPSHTKLHVVMVSDLPINKDLTFDHLEVTFRIGTSFISAGQAEANIPYLSYEEQVKVNDMKWNDVLSNILIRDYNTYDKRLEVKRFYTILHRALLFPRVMSELHYGSVKHYSPYSGEIESGQVSTDSGFWDAYRTVYPFLHLVYPSLATRVLDGWVNSIKESPKHLLPQWASPGPVGSMQGTMGEVSIAEGIINDAITDVDTAWNYLYTSAFVTGRDHFDEYLMFGYVPGQVSLSLNYYLCDYVVALAAYKLGHIKMGDSLMDRSKRWHLIFDTNKRFFRPKTMGRFSPSFDEHKWMGPYMEGGPHQYRFYLPFDPEGLNNAYGYKMCDYLKRMMTGPNTVSNRQKIHEETEMQQHSFGQYAHNNQVVHHVLYMFAHVGCEHEGQKWLNHALDTQYSNEGYAGDEDNGEMSAWYIMSRLGLYSLVPGSGEYQIGIPPPWKEVILKERDIVIKNKYNKNYWTYMYINGEEKLAQDVPKIRLKSKQLINF